MNAAVNLEKGSFLHRLESDKSAHSFLHGKNFNHPSAGCELDNYIHFSPQAWSFRFEPEDFHQRIVKKSTRGNSATMVETCKESFNSKECRNLATNLSLQIDECRERRQQEGNTVDSLGLEGALSIMGNADELSPLESYMCNIQGCRKHKSSVLGGNIYLLLCERGLETNEALGNHAVPMLVDCGIVHLALQLFKRLTYVSEHAWTSLILGLAEVGQPECALNFYQKMQEDGVQPSSHTVVTLLKICARLDAVDLGRCLYMDISLRGFERDPFVCNTLIHMYAKCGLLAEAKEIFDKVPLRNTVTWNTLLAAYAENGLYLETLELSESMEKDGVSPDAFTYACSVKACSSVGAIDRGRELHKKIHVGECKTDAFLGNSLVGMYAKCGSLSEAREVFDSLPNQDVVGWSALIAGYTEHGPFQEALKCFEKMQLLGFLPDAITYASVLRACANAGLLERGQELHKELVEKGIEASPLLGNNLVGMYAKCGYSPEALKVFHILSVSDIKSWNALITGLIEHGLFEEAFDCFRNLDLHGVSPDSVTFACSLKACIGMGLVQEGHGIHIQVVSRGLEGNTMIGNTLIGLYSRNGLLPEALQTFGSLSDRDVVSWNALIAGYVEHDVPKEVLKCFEQMQMEGILPDVATYRSIFKAFSNIEFAERGVRLHLQVFPTALNQDLALGNALISMYAKVGLLVQAQKVFDELPLHDIVSWNALISGYGEHDSIDAAFKTYKKMLSEGFCLDSSTYACVIKACDRNDLVTCREVHMDFTKQGIYDDVTLNTLVGVYAKCGSDLDAQHIFDRVLVSDVISWTSLIAGYAEHGPFEEALARFDRMQSEGILQNAITYACILKACGSLMNIERGLETHAEIVRKGFDQDAGTSNTLVSMYAKCGLSEEAWEVFDKLPFKDHVSWTALISGYSDSGLCKEALDCFEHMQQEGVTSNVSIFASIIKTCGSIGALDKAHDIVLQLYQRGLDKDPMIVNSLIGMYSKCGLLSEARKTFDSLCSRDAIIWSSMIQGYGMNNEGGMAIECFEEMQKQRVKPDVVTFTCLLNSCSHTSLISKGFEYFKLMRELYGVAPKEDHYTCLADLLARSGKLLEAENFAETFCPCSEGAWLTLLTACRTCGEVELGSRCFERLVCLNAGVAAWYAVMVDIYEDDGLFEDAVRLEDLRKHVGAKKKRASATIEVNKKVHEFVVGTNSNSDITLMLEALNGCLKEGGHMPNLDQISHPKCDSIKETSLYGHAEKLAIAFGLLNTPQGVTLRVTKNLRMCDDCHNASKVVSKVERREIILRDNCCLHHFKDGVCSCGDAF